MNPFYTITDKNTEFTNSRSTRYPTFQAAETAAQERLILSQRLEAVYVLKVCAVVEAVRTPTKTTMVG